MAFNKGYLLEMQLRDQGFFHVYNQRDRCCIASFASEAQLMNHLQTEGEVIDQHSKVLTY
jgi:heat shock protein HspQ